MKNLLLILAILVPSASVFSQLYVTPNTTSSTDSYIYVSDEVLFVEDDINLVKNTNVAATEGSIYLRNGAQLIQGTGSTLNSGTGLISIYQTVDSTSYYHYNFWHSPVGNQTLGGGSAGNKNAGVSRLFDVDNVTASTQALTTGGVNGANGDPITISTRWIYKRHSSNANGAEANYVWVGGTDGVEPGYGFLMKGIGEDPGAGYNTQIYDFRGRPNNGDVTVPVLSGVKWTLSGNPYPSAIDLKDFYADNTGITEILFWDEPKDSEFSHYYRDKSGGYGTWIPGGGTGDEDPGLYTAATYNNYDSTGFGSGSGTGPPNIDRRYAPVGQGFVLQTNYGVATNVTLMNSHRTFRKIGEVSEFRTPESSGDSQEEVGFNTISDDQPVNDLTPQFRINVVMNEEYARQLLMAFSENSTDGYDRGLDAHHPMDAGGGEAYFPLLPDNDPFVIQTLPFDMNKEIPISFILVEQTKFIVKTQNIINCQNLFRAAYLFDRVEGTYQKFTNGKSATQYLPAGIYEDRFFIVFQSSREVIENSEGTLVIEEVRESVDFFQNNPSKQMEVSNPEEYDIKSALIYDMAGKLVINKTNIGTDRNFNISTSNLSDGVYLIKLMTSENIEIDYKMIINNR